MFRTVNCHPFFERVIVTLKCNRKYLSESKKMDLSYYTRLFLIILTLLLFGYYLIPAGGAYLYFYVFKKEDLENKHIQKNYPTRQSIKREIKWSLISVVILAFIVLILYRLIVNGYTKMYFSVKEYGWFYLIASCIFTIIAYDTYFYWIHRFMHLKKIFPWIHKTHHLSHTPSPWAILAFNPIETVIEFAIYPIMIFLFPLHPIAIGVFALHNIILNTAGHIGFEVVPKSFFHHWLLKYGLTVTHHDMHHAKTNCNYGIYFNIWDRIMKTNHPEYEKTFYKQEEKEQKQ
jgi:Delta7-sterol 5-desaturase